MADVPDELAHEVPDQNEEQWSIVTEQGETFDPLPVMPEGEDLFPKSEAGQ